MMKKPHEVFGLPAGAGETEIRQRYLELVRQYPPDSAPERFAEIRAAFDQLRDPVARYERGLQDLETTDSIDAICTELLGRAQHAGLSMQALASLAETA